MSTSVGQHLRERLRNKIYRDAFVDQNIRTGIASQIRATRESRGWTQSELGKRAGKVQETISQLEDPDYGRLTLKTLKQIASAFDVALVVKFVPFSNIVDWLADLEPSDLAVADFENDSFRGAFEEVTVPVDTVASVSVLTTSIQEPTLDVAKITDISDYRQRRKHIPPPHYTLAQTAGRRIGIE